MLLLIIKYIACPPKVSVSESLRRTGGQLQLVGHTEYGINEAHEVQRSQHFRLDLLLGKVISIYFICFLQHKEKTISEIIKYY